MSQCPDPLIVALTVLRKALGVSQEAVAIAIGTSQGQISDYENGRQSPTLRILRRWAAALGRDLGLAYLLEEAQL